MSFVSDFFKDVSGRTARDAATKAGELQSQAGIDAANQVGIAGQSASALYDPFRQVGQQGIDQAGFLGDASNQYNWLQNNPMFQMGLDNANQQTNARAASSGRLSAGDTLMQLNNNALLTAMPLLDRQRSDVMSQLNFGQGIAGHQAGILQNTAINQANLNTGAAAAQAGGIVGGANAMAGGAENLINIGAAIAGGMSGTPPMGGSGGGGGFGQGQYGNFVNNNQNLGNLFGSP